MVFVALFGLCFELVTCELVKFLMWKGVMGTGVDAAMKLCCFS